MRMKFTSTQSGDPDIEAETTEAAFTDAWEPIGWKRAPAADQPVDQPADPTGPSPTDTTGVQLAEPTRSKSTKSKS